MAACGLSVHLHTALPQPMRALLWSSPAKKARSVNFLGLLWFKQCGKREITKEPNQMTSVPVWVCQHVGRALADWRKSNFTSPVTRHGSATRKVARQTVPNPPSRPVSMRYLCMPSQAASPDLADASCSKGITCRESLACSWSVCCAQGGSCATVAPEECMGK